MWYDSSAEGSKPPCGIGYNTLETKVFKALVALGDKRLQRLSTEAWLHILKIANCLLA
jgi:hypothetical protein